MPQPTSRLRPLRTALAAAAALALLAACDSPTALKRLAGSDVPGGGPLSTRGPVLTRSAAGRGMPWAGVPVRRTVQAAADVGAAGPFYYLLWQNRTTGDRVLWPMNGTLRAGTEIFLPHEDPVWDMAAIADFTGDGDPEILFQNKSTGNRGMWSLKGTTWNRWIQLYGEKPVWDFAAAADFTGDGQPDIVLQNTSTGERGFWWMNHEAYRDWIAATTEQPSWRMAAAADFTGDGQNDIVFENTQTGQRGIWVMNGTVYQSWISFATEVPVWQMAAAYDATGDRSPDILFQNTQTGQRGWWIMSGTQYQRWVDLGTVAPEWDIVGAFTPGGAQPADASAPSNLAASTNTAGPVALTWTDNSTTEDKYVVQRSVGDPNSFVLVAELPANATRYDDPRTGATQTLYYRVRACNATGCTAWSNIAVAQTDPAGVNRPTGLTATPVSTSSIALHWTDNASDETEYQILYSYPTPSYVQTNTVRLAANSTSYTFTNLNPNTPYTFQVRACNATVCTAYSDAVTTPTQDATAGPPVITNATAELATAAAVVVVRAAVDANGGVATTYVEWSTDPSFANPVRVNAQTANGRGTVEVYLSIPQDTTRTYYARVGATNSKGTTLSPVLSFVPGPPPITNYQATWEPDKGHVVQVRWDPVPGRQFSHISLVRKDVATGESETRLYFYGSSFADFGGFTDGVSDLSRAHTYLYTLEKCNGYGCNRATLTVSTTALAPPANLAASSPSAGTITATWQDNEPYEQGYYLTARPAAGGSSTTVGLGANAQTGTIAGLAPGRYFVTAQSFVGGSTSLPSNEAEVVVQ